MKKKIIGLFFVLILVLISVFVYLKFKNIKNSKLEFKESDIYSSNIIKDINYKTKDLKGNEYIINASEGEIDVNNNKIIFLKNVRALIKLNNSNKINITSNFGKYNMDNFDTIFSENVIIKYLDNIITGENLDYSMNRGSMIISRKVIYIKNENTLKADVVEIDTDTKDTKIFMYDINDKVNIKNF